MADVVFQEKPRTGNLLHKGALSTLLAMSAQGALLASVELFDVFGASCGKVDAADGLVRLPVPASGYACVKWGRLQKTRR